MSIGDSSLLLWLMAAAVVLLAAHVFVSWVRRAQSAAGARLRIGPVALASGALGMGLSSSMILTMSSQGLVFPLGYRWVAVPVLLLLPILLCAPAAWWLARRQNWLALVGCSVLLAAVVISLQVGWVLAAGLKPGVRWQFLLLGAAAGVQVMGFLASLWLAYSDASGDDDRRTLWRAGAAALLALTVVAGQELVVSAAGLLTQVGSIYQRQASATWLCLLAGALMPTVLALLSLDAWLRGQGELDSRRSGGGSSGFELNMPKRRKRRRRYRAL
jgi:hypothetical protein